MKDEGLKSKSRRRFFRAGLSTGVLGAAGAVALNLGGEEAEAAEPGKKKSAGYHESEYVRAYYERARF